MRALVIALSASTLVLVAVPAVPVPIHLWSQSYGSITNDQARAVATDVSGNVVITGAFTGTVDFGGGGLTSAGGDDIFVAKFDAAGAHLWSRKFGDVTNDTGTGVVVDADGNVVVVGSFTGTVDFGGGAIASLGGDDAFVLRLDAGGNHLWSRRIGGTGADGARGVTVDGSNRLIVVGSFSNTVDFGISGPATSRTSAGGLDGFAAAYNNDASPAWSRAYGGTSEDVATGVAADGSFAIVSGNFWGTAVLDSDNPGSTSVSLGNYDGFIVKHDAGGSVTWKKQVGGTSWDEVSSLCIGSGGDIIATGFFSTLVDFGGGPLLSAGGTDVFMARYDAAGTHSWSKHFGAAWDDRGYDVVVSATGVISFCGNFQGSVDFGGGLFISLGVQDIFLATYDPAGLYQWGFSTGNISTDIPYGVTVDTQGNIFLTGYYRTAVNLGGTTLTAVGGRDVFLAKYGEAPTAVGPVAVATLSQNHPNPFNPSTTVEYTLAIPASVSLSIFDARGARVTRLEQGWRDAGVYRVTWDGRDAAGRPVASGLYFCRLDGAGDVPARKMVLLK